jgi:hypothetical protein
MSSGMATLLHCAEPLEPDIKQSVLRIDANPDLYLSLDPQTFSEGIEAVPWHSAVMKGQLGFWL